MTTNLKWTFRFGKTEKVITADGTGWDGLTPLYFNVSRVQHNDMRGVRCWGLLMIEKPGKSLEWGIGYAQKVERIYHKARMGIDKDNVTSAIKTMHKVWPREKWDFLEYITAEFAEYLEEKE